MNDRLETFMLAAVSAALALSLMSDTVSATFGVSLLAAALLIPIACCIRLHRDLNSLIFSGLLWRLVVIGLVTFWILPYYAARNSADAVWYNNQAADLAQAIRAGDWWQLPLNVGSDLVTVVTALFYVPFGPSSDGVTFLSGLLGFVGSLCFVAAAAAALPEKNLREYAIFAMLLPSIVFWSTLFGKDSWVFFGLGISALGVAQWLKYRTWSGLLKVLIGMGIVGVFRPHIALATALSFALTTLVCRKRSAPLSGTKSVAVLLVLAPATFLLWRGVSYSTGITEVSEESIVGRTSEQGVYTQLGGGSDVATNEIQGTRGFVSQLPEGAVRLLFRPWPWEAKSPFMFLAALDNLILIGILAVRRRDVMDTLRNLRTRPFAFFSVVLAIELIMIFSTIANLGLLMREKTQITPFLYVLAFCGNRRAASRTRPVRRNEDAHARLNRIPARARLDPAGAGASNTQAS